jgi:hypothetical protein
MKANRRGLEVKKRIEKKKSFKGAIKKLFRYA